MADFAERPGNILLIKPGSLGDVIHALPCAETLKRHWPESRITWLVDDRWRSILTGNPHIDEMIIFPRRDFRGLKSLHAIPWMTRLGALQPNLAIDLQGLLRSALMARFSGARQTVGLKDAREGARFFYDKAAPVRVGEHSVWRYLRVLELLGLPAPEEPEFWLPEGEPCDQISGLKSYVLLHPFARGNGKSLSEEDVVTFCRSLGAFPVVLAGTGNLTVELPENTINLLNKTTLGQLIWCLRRASFVVSVDSGPMHIAAAAGCQLLSIHTWSDPRLVGPFQKKAWIWQGGEIRRQSLEAEYLPGGKPPGTEDIEALAEFVRERLRKG